MSGPKPENPNESAWRKYSAAIRESDSTKINELPNLELDRLAEPEVDDCLHVDHVGVDGPTDEDIDAVTRPLRPMVADRFEFIGRMVLKTFIAFLGVMAGLSIGVIGAFIVGDVLGYQKLAVMVAALGAALGGVIALLQVTRRSD